MSPTSISVFLFSNIQGLSLEMPGSPSLTSALTGLVGQNYLQLLQALQQQQQQGTVGGCIRLSVNIPICTCMYEERHAVYT